MAPVLFRRFPPLALCALLLSLSCCHSKHPMEPYQTEKFALDAAPGAAGSYPVQIHRGEFTNSATSTRFVVPYGHYLQDSWGTSGIAWGVGDEQQPVPDSLHLRWFAWAENQFYEGRFALPQRKIYDLLKQGFWDQERRQHTTYSSLTVCVLPKGGVVVWLGGGNQVLVGRFQGRPINYDWLRYSAGRDDRAQLVAERQAKMLPQVRAEIAAGTISSRQWDTYLAAVYPWKLEAAEQDGRQELPLRLRDYSVDYLNAEGFSYPPTQDLGPYLRTMLELSPKPVPRELHLHLENRYHEKHLLRIDPFDEAETLAAFQALHARHPQEPIVLRVLVDKRVTKVALSVSNGFQTIPLDKATVKHFEE